jgi:NAD(P)-dependent dehydrogenase (short-subunit alcohol dehydrogenase family)
MRVSLERRLEGKVALVTGASSGNGLAIALRFAREGASVVCADVRGLPDEAGSDAFLYVRCDVRSGDDVCSAVDSAVERFGRLDVAVANAGVNLGVNDLVEEPFDLYRRTVEINQDGAWWTCREASRRMLEQGAGGRIIVVASIASLVGSPSGVAYNTSKGAVLALVRTLAAQLAPSGITVNAICPGYIRTPMTAETQRDATLLERALAAHPLGRLGEPEDVAGAAFYLASDDAGWVTGTALTVDGGYTCV